MSPALCIDFKAQESTNNRTRFGKRTITHHLPSCSQLTKIERTFSLWWVPLLYAAEFLRPGDDRRLSSMSMWMPQWQFAVCHFPGIRSLKHIVERVECQMLYKLFYYCCCRTIKAAERNDNWMNEAVQEFAFPSFTLITHRGSRKGLSCLKQHCQQLCYPLTASACEVSSGDSEGDFCISITSDCANGSCCGFSEIASWLSQGHI